MRRDVEGISTRHTSDSQYVGLLVHGLVGACIAGSFSLLDLGNLRSPNIKKESYVLAESIRS